MVSTSFQELSDRRAARARELCERFPASSEALTFYAELVSFQGEIFLQAQEWDDLPHLRGALVDLVLARGPERLRDAARALGEEAFRKALTDYRNGRDTESLMSFFARVMLQPHAAASPTGRPTVTPVSSETNRCPSCRHRPQVGILRPEADGTAFSLVCSLCPNIWDFRQAQCAGCGENPGDELACYATPDFDHLQVQACDRCGVYVHVIDLGEEPAAIPEADELAALPLDVWARERGYRKLQPNLAGI